MMTSRFFPSAWLRVLMSLAMVPLMASCTLFAPKPVEPPKPPMWGWNDHGGPGKLSIHIDLSEQMATYYRGKKQVGWSYISSGKEGSDTQPGDYKICEKDEVRYSNLYGWISDANGVVTNGNATPKSPVPAGEFYHPAPMRHWMRLTWDGVGLHAGEIPKPGEASSHGCIRLPKDFAPVLYKAAPMGTPVKVERGKRWIQRQRGTLT
jgi:lipoprotein-anchoring transpeptidase ErfK/SrfK